MALSIGFIGLGAMGLPMACNLVTAGHSVKGFDLKPKSLGELAQKGGTLVPDSRAAAHNADILILMVVNAKQASDILLRKWCA